MGAFERRAPSAAAGDTSRARSSEGEATLLASEKIEDVNNLKGVAPAAPIYIWQENGGAKQVQTGFIEKALKRLKKNYL